VFSFFLSLLILTLSAILVTAIYTLAAYIQNNVVEQSAWINFLISLIPAVGLILIDALTSYLLEQCVELERWDFISTKNIQLMWRMYIAKIFTVLIVYILVIYLSFFGKTVEDIFGITLFDFQMNLTCGNGDMSKLTQLSDFTKVSYNSNLISYNKYNNCKEDVAAGVILINLLVDFASRKIIPFIVNFSRWLWIVQYKGGKDYFRPYKVIDTACDTLVFYIQMFSLIPIFPFIILLAPVVIFADFKFEIFHLSKLRSKPKELSLQDKMAYFMVTIFSFTMLAVNLMFLLYFSYGAGNANYLNCYDNETYVFGPQQCGPFAGLETLKIVVLDYIANNNL
jgi:hypothetical protein